MKVFFFSVGFFFSTGIPLQEIFSPRNQAALQDNFFWNHLLIPPSKVKGSAPYYRLNSTEIRVTVLKITDFPHSQHLDNEQGVREYSGPKQTRCLSQVWQWCNTRENRLFSLVQYQRTVGILGHNLWRVQGDKSNSGPIMAIGGITTPSTSGDFPWKHSTVVSFIGK